MGQEEYDSKIPCRFPLSMARFSAAHLFIHTGAGRRPPSFTIYNLPFTIYHLQFTIYNFPYVFPTSQDSTESGTKKEALFRELLFCL